MANLIFEELVPAHFHIAHGEVTLYEGPSAGGFAGGPPTNIIQTDQSWGVKFTWKNFGLLVPFISANWKLSIYLEQLGQAEFGFAANQGKKTVPYVAVNPHVYNEAIDIPANLVPEGLYKLTACVEFESLSGIPGPVAAFAELGAVKFYKA